MLALNSRLLLGTTNVKINSSDGRFLARFHLAEDTQRVRIFHTSSKDQLRWRDVVSLWTSDVAFADFYTEVRDTPPPHAVL